MLRIANKLVYDYINGEDVNNIDELENDYKFMMEVISVSGDKNLYNLCSENVKSNYEFVRFMIETFKSDKDFVDKIATEYFDKVGSSDMTARELYFVMREIFKNYNDDRGILYNIICFKIYMADKDAISKLIQYEYKELGNDNLGMGFCYVIDYHARKSDIITRYYAKRFLNEIFYENEKMTLEEIIHSKVTNVGMLKSIGLKKFILDYVKTYDAFLSDYLFAHMDLVQNLERDINIIINNWDKFNNEMLERKNYIFQQEVNDLIMKYNASFDYTDVCSYLDANFDFSVKFGIKGFEEIFCIDVKKIDLVEYECLRKIIQLAKDLFGSPVIDTDYEYKEVDNTPSIVKGRVLEFKPNKRNNI